MINPLRRMKVNWGGRGTPLTLSKPLPNTIKDNFQPKATEKKMEKVI